MVKIENETMRENQNKATGDWTGKISNDATYIFTICGLGEIFGIGRSTSLLARVAL